MLPRPAQVEWGSGRFALDADLAVTAPAAWAAIVRRLLSPGTGLALPDATDGRLRVTADPSLPAEGYRLTVTEDGVTVAVASDRGVNWAVQTLCQLLPPGRSLAAPDGEALFLPTVALEDRPRFSWRGVMLDVARHHYPLPELFWLVDLLAMHKYNVLQLHLTDDQGWRFESRRHPRLNEIASWRAGTRRPGDADSDHTPHGGLYTQDQLRALVTYAGQRGIDIVPELEFPGHVRAVLAAYPELSNTPERHHRPAETFGVFEEVLSLSEEAMGFVFDLYEELLAVFPGRYVHVGGDECPRTEWLASPAAQTLAWDRGLGGPAELQRWFTTQLHTWLSDRGRTLVGWDEICDEGAVPGAVAMVWRERTRAMDAAADGGMGLVLAPTSHTYFDYYAGAGPDEPRANPGGVISTSRAYAFEPLDGVPAPARDWVLGTQCQVWTEYLPTFDRVEYQLFPRACAHSEVAWSAAQGRSWAEFEPRLALHLERLAALGVNYRPESGPRPWQRGGTGYFRRPRQPGGAER